jgi:hypothetical protein
VDSTQFDTMTKAWAAGASRRGMLRLLVGGTLGGLLALGSTRSRTLAVGCETAADCPNESHLCKDYACRNRTCVLENLPDNTPCQEGGNPCTDDICIGGVCTHPPKPDGATCGDGRVCSQLHCCPVTRPTFCEQTGSCTNLRTDESNCGSCGRQCSGSRVCRKGRCRRR